MDIDLSEELESLVQGLYQTQVVRSVDEGGGVKLSFITNNRLYQLRVQTEDQPDEFILSGGEENPYLEAPPAVMQAFVRQMRVRFPSADYSPRARMAPTSERRPRAGGRQGLLFRMNSPAASESSMSAWMEPPESSAKSMGD